MGTTYASASSSVTGAIAPRHGNATQIEMAIKTRSARAAERGWRRAEATRPALRIASVAPMPVKMTKAAVACDNDPVRAAAESSNAVRPKPAVIRSATRS